MWRFRPNFTNNLHLHAIRFNRSQKLFVNTQVRSLRSDLEVKIKGSRERVLARVFTLSQNGYGEQTARSCVYFVSTQNFWSWHTEKSWQHPKVFPDGPPVQYWPGPATVNFGVRKRSGVFGAVWPPANIYPRAWHSCTDRIILLKKSEKFEKEKSPELHS